MIIDSRSIRWPARIRNTSQIQSTASSGYLYPYSRNPASYAMNGFPFTNLLLFIHQFKFSSNKGKMNSISLDSKNHVLDFSKLTFPGYLQDNRQNRYLKFLYNTEPYMDIPMQLYQYHWSVLTCPLKDLEKCISSLAISCEQCQRASPYARRGSLQQRRGPSGLQRTMA